MDDDAVADQRILQDGAGADMAVAADAAVAADDGIGRDDGAATDRDARADDGAGLDDDAGLETAPWGRRRRGGEMPVSAVSAAGEAAAG